MPQKNSSNVARESKAAIKSPNVSKDAKECDYERLQEMGFDPHQHAHRNGKTHDSDLNRKLGTSLFSCFLSRSVYLTFLTSGHKAAIKNPNVSAEAKQHSRRVLEGEAALHSHSQTKRADISNKNPDNIVSRHKVDMKSTRFSEKIKEHTSEPVEAFAPQ